MEMLNNIIIAFVCTFNFLVAYQALCNMGEKMEGGLHKAKYLMTLVGTLCCLYITKDSPYIALTLSLMIFTWLTPRVIYYFRYKNEHLD